MAEVLTMNLLLNGSEQQGFLHDFVRAGGNPGLSISLLTVLADFPLCFSANGRKRLGVFTLGNYGKELFALLDGGEER
jgi:hypothetical protein